MSDLMSERHTINCDADQFVLEGWTIVEHKKMGQFTFDPTRIKLYLSENQIEGKHIEGNKLRKELADIPVLNVDVLDYLLKNPERIPEEWKKDDNGNTRYIFFWGTIYRSSDDDLFVRCLYFLGGEWRGDDRWLSFVWRDDSPAASFAS